jgi:hypothetical protein
MMKKEIKTKVVGHHLYRHNFSLSGITSSGVTEMIVLDV